MYRGSRRVGKTYATRCQGLIQKKCGIEACFITKLPSSNGPLCKRTCLECAHDWFRQFVTHVDQTWNVRDNARNKLLWYDPPPGNPDDRRLRSVISDVCVFIVMTRCQGAEEKVYRVDLPLVEHKARWHAYQKLLFNNLKSQACHALHIVVDFDLKGLKNKVPLPLIRRAIQTRFPDPNVRRLMKAGGRLEFDQTAEVLAIVFDSTVRDRAKMPILYLTLQTPPNAEILREIQFQLLRMAAKDFGSQAKGFAHLWLARTRLQQEYEKARRIRAELEAAYELHGTDQNHQRIGRLRQQLETLLLPAEDMESLETLFASVYRLSGKLENPKRTERRRWIQAIRSFHYLSLEPLALFPEIPDLKQYKQRLAELKMDLGVPPRPAKLGRNPKDRERLVDMWKRAAAELKRLEGLAREQNQEREETRILKVQLKQSIKTTKQLINSSYFLQMQLDETNRMNLIDAEAKNATIERLRLQLERLKKGEEDMKRVASIRYHELKNQFDTLQKRFQRQQHELKESAQRIVDFAEGRISIKEAMLRIVFNVSNGIGEEENRAFLRIIGSLHNQKREVIDLKQGLAQAVDAQNDFQTRLENLTTNFQEVVNLFTEAVMEEKHHPSHAEQKFKDISTNHPELFAILAEQAPNIPLVLKLAQKHRQEAEAFQQILSATKNHLQLMDDQLQQGSGVNVEAMRNKFREWRTTLTPAAAVDGGLLDSLRKVFGATQAWLLQEQKWRQEKEGLEQQLKAVEEKHRTALQQLSTANSQLETANQELRHKNERVQGLEDRLRSLNENIQDLQREAKESKTRARTDAQTIKELEARVADLTSQLEDRLAEKEEKTRNLRDLRARQAESDTMIQDLQRQLDLLKTNLQNIQRELAESKQKREEERKRNEDLDRRLRESQAQENETQTELQKAQTDLSEKARELTSLEAKLRESKSQLEELQAENSQISNLNVEIETSHKRARQHTTDLERKLTEQEQKQKELSDAHRQLESQLENDQKRIAGLEGKYAEEQARRNELEDRLQQSEEAFRTEIANTDGRILQLRASKQKIQADLDSVKSSLQRKLRQHEEDVATLTEEKSRTEASVRSLQRSLNDKQRELEELATRYREQGLKYNNDIQSLDSERKRIQEELRQAQADAQSQKQIFEHQLAEQGRKLAKLKNEFTQLLEQKTQAESRLGSVDNELDTTKNELQRLESQGQQKRAQLQARIQALEEENAKLNTDQLRLQGEFDELGTAKNELQRLHSKGQQERAQLQARIQALEEEKAKLNTDQFRLEGKVAKLTASIKVRAEQHERSLLMANEQREQELKRTEQALEGNIEVLNKLVKVQQGTIDTLTRELNFLTRRKDELKAKRIEQEQKIVAQQQELNKVRDLTKALQTQFKASTRALRAQLEAKNRQLGQLRDMEAVSEEQKALVGDLQRQLRDHNEFRRRVRRALAVEVSPMSLAEQLVDPLTTTDEEASDIADNFARRPPDFRQESNNLIQKIESLVEESKRGRNSFEEGKMLILQSISDFAREHNLSFRFQQGDPVDVQIRNFLFELFRALPEIPQTFTAWYENLFGHQPYLDVREIMQDLPQAVDQKLMETKTSLEQCQATHRQLKRQLKSNIDQHAEELKKIREDLDEAQAEKEQMETRNKTLTVRVQDYDDTFNRQTTEMDQLKNRNQELTDDLKNYNRTREDLIKCQTSLRELKDRYNHLVNTEGERLEQIAHQTEVNRLLRTEMKERINRAVRFRHLQEEQDREEIRERIRQEGGSSLETQVDLLSEEIEILTRKMESVKNMLREHSIPIPSNLS